MFFVLYSNLAIQHIVLDIYGIIVLEILNVVLEGVGTLTEILKLFQQFFSFPVPLGVCAVVSVLVVYLFSKLQENRRNDYELSYKQQTRIINSQEEIIQNRNQRISELENTIFNSREE